MALRGAVSASVGQGVNGGGVSGVGERGGGGVSDVGVRRGGGVITPVYGVITQGVITPWPTLVSAEDLECNFDSVWTSIRSSLVENNL